MLYFGFFDTNVYDDSNEKFDDFKNLENDLPKEEILKYIQNLPVGAISPMIVTDMFTGDRIELVGLYIDDDFIFPLEFLYYYKNYDIGVPKEYENYIKTKL